MNPHDACVAVVDHNPDRLFAIEILLREKVGVKTYAGHTSGAQLFAWLEQSGIPPVDLILLDVQIPYEDGFAVFARIRSHPRLRQTRVVAVAANVIQFDIEKARTVGFDGCVGTPIDKQWFASQIRWILDGAAIWEMD